jgi:hypothetical protein
MKQSIFTKIQTQNRMQQHTYNSVWWFVSAYERHMADALYDFV